MNINEHQAHSRIFLSGATGYIGGRLAPRLLHAGYRVRCVVRDPRKLQQRDWSDHPNLEVVKGSIDNHSELLQAMKGCTSAYYLVHSMVSAGPAYRNRDRDLAEQFAACAKESKVGRIIYLGGLGEMSDGLSEHLTSRREVEKALASTGVPLTVLRAAMIIGSGSASFEIMRYLVERLPIMITPKWVDTLSQPISVRNVLSYLVRCLETPATIGHTFDIGGQDVMSYREIMQLMAKSLGLQRRWVIPVPVLTPRLSSLWIHLVTPLDARIARPLAEGLRNRVVCKDDAAVKVMPQKLLSVSEAINAALGKVQNHEIETIWSDAGQIPGDPDWAGGKLFIDQRAIKVACNKESLFSAICRTGGGKGYYAADSLWRLRGLLDRLVGGPGLRRGRRDPEQLGYGDALDFWRVTDIDPSQRLELRAEMKVPGEATLTFEMKEHQDGIVLVQTARFRPQGLAGIAYWYALTPLHHIVFEGLLKGIKRDAESNSLESKSQTEKPSARAYVA